MQEDEDNVPVDGAVLDPEETFLDLWTRFALGVGQLLQTPLLSLRVLEGAIQDRPEVLQRVKPRKGGRAYTGLQFGLKYIPRAQDAFDTIPNENLLQMVRKFLLMILHYFCTTKTFVKEELQTICTSAVNDYARSIDQNLDDRRIFRDTAAMFSCARMTYFWLDLQQLRSLATKLKLSKKYVTNVATPYTLLTPELIQQNCLRYFDRDGRGPLFFASGTVETRSGLKRMRFC